MVYKDGYGGHYVSLSFNIHTIKEKQKTLYTLFKKTNKQYDKFKWTKWDLDPALFILFYPGVKSASLT